MNENSEIYEQLAVRYFSGEASPEELDQLSHWLSSDPLNKRIFEEYRQVWLLTTQDAFSKNINVDSDWQELKARIDRIDNNKPASKGKLKSMRVPLLAAASVVITVILAAVLHFTVLKTRTITEIAVNSNREVVLPDGSEIILAMGSTIRYPETFKGDSRKIDLEGQAHFKISHDKKRPFIVSAEDLSIMVLGTEFNVNTRASAHSTSVVLERGKVSLFFNDNKQTEIILNPGERADVDILHKQIVKSGNYDKNYNAWLTGVIEFDNTPLTLIASTLSQTFARQVKVSNDQSTGCTLTATFKDQSLDEVLEVIQATLDIQVIQKDNVIYLDGNCK